MNAVSESHFNKRTSNVKRFLSTRTVLCQGSSDTGLASDNNNDNKKKNKDENIIEEEWTQKALFPYIDDSVVILLAPAIMFIMAFFLFDETTTIFHALIIEASGKSGNLSMVTTPLLR